MKVVDFGLEFTGKVYLNNALLPKIIARTYYRIGNDYAKNNDPNKAIYYCKKALNLYPQIPDACVTLSAVLIIKDNLEEGLEWCNKALDIDSNCAGSYGNLTFISLQRKDYKKALDYAKKHVELDPDSYDAHFNLGICWFNENEYDKSVEHFNKSEELEYKDPKLYIYRAITYLQSGNLKKAKIDFNKIKNINPEKLNPECADFYRRLEKACSNKLRHYFGTIRSKIQKIINL